MSRFNVWRLAIYFDLVFQEQGCGRRLVERLEL